MRHANRLGTPRHSRSAAAALVAAVIAVAALTVLTSAEAQTTPAQAVHRGGTYRVAFESSFGFTDGLDPTGEYFQHSLAILTNLLVRPLLEYDHVAGRAGNTLVPDLATAVPVPTGGGTIYTLHLKSGVRFGPPVSRAVTSADVLSAFKRLGRPSDGAEYAFYYSVIAGFDAYASGKAKTIAGISTPDARTIVFRLTAPAGDFAYRLALPATAPIPPEVGRCFEGQAGRYGKDLVSTGPYMIEGADVVDASSCATLKAMSGWDGVSRLALVRNPDYDAATDTPAARESLPDRFEFTVDASGPDIVNRVEAGQLDDEATASLPPQALERYATNPAKRHLLHLNPGDGTSYLTMNLTQPPFDDIHVRRAMNLIIDKRALQQVNGGPLTGAIATHIVPDTMFDGELTGYDPYRTPGHRGSVEEAKAAMRGSRYDLHHDGMCSASACHDVLLLADAQSVYQRMLPSIVADAKKIGVTFHVSSIAGAFPTLQTTSKNIAIAIFPGWFKDYADAGTFFAPLFDGRTIIRQGNVNYSLVGLKPGQAKSLGVTGTTSGIPNVDARLDRCSRLAGTPRRRCYEALDRYMMREVVPWVPWQSPNFGHIVSAQVTRWVFDQSNSATGYAHVAVR
jgi:peptide/nickel transport system substrate-binding protein